MDSALPLECMQVSGRPWNFGGLAASCGRLDSFWAEAGLAPAAGHNTIIPFQFDLGLVDSAKAWENGAVAVLPKLAGGTTGYTADAIQAVRAVWLRRCRDQGLVCSRGRLRYAQHFRLLDVISKRGGR